MKDLDKTEYVESAYEDNDATTAYIDTEVEDELLNSRYRILEVAGKGGMSVVYKAEDSRLKNNIVAIKQIKIDNHVSTFENEADALIKLRHTSIPRILEYFVVDDKDGYIVMDYIEGKTIYNIVKENGPMTESEVLKYLNKISNVLEYLHSRDPKIIFRDLKPSNVMVDIDNNIKLIDFGIARNFDVEKENDTAYYVSHGYSAPEQYGFGQSDEKSDIFSLGCVLYFMLTSKKPQINSSNYINDIESLEISTGLKRAILSAMDYRADLRPKSIQEFMNIVGEQKSKVTSKFTKKTNNKKIKSIVTASLLLMIMGTTFIVGKLANKGNDSGNTNNNTEGKSKEIQKVDSVISDSSTTSEIEKARKKLYEVTGASQHDTNYELNTDSSYIGTEKVKENFYIFNIAAVYSGDLADYNYAVQKSDLSVYYGDTYGMLIPYEDYINSESKMYSFLSDYWTYGQEGTENEVKKQFDKLGAEKFLEKVKPIVDESDDFTVEYYGGYVNYVDLILNGSTKEELDDYVERRMNPIDYPTYDMEALYQEYGDYFDYDKEYMDSVFLEGWLEGVDYNRPGNSTKQKDIEEYIYINSPEHVGGIIWTVGFWEGYNSLKDIN